MHDGCKVWGDESVLEINNGGGCECTKRHWIVHLKKKISEGDKFNILYILQFFLSIWGECWEDRKLIEDNSKLYDAFDHPSFTKTWALLSNTPAFKFLTTYVTLDIHIFFQRLGFWNYKLEILRPKNWP